VALALAKRNVQVDILCPPEKFETIRRVLPKDPNIRNLKFATETSREGILRWKGPGRLFGKNQSILSAYDRVVSDNLPEVLEARHDAILSGHFLWHNVFEETPQKYKEYVRDLIQQHKPVVISSSLFACEEIKKIPRFRPTGLYAFSSTEFAEVQPVRNRRALLLAGGSTGLAASMLEKMIPPLLELGRHVKAKVFLDPSLACRMSPPGNNSAFPVEHVEKADYKQSMYRQIRFGLVRPGVGTLTDLLFHGAMPVCIYEPNNSEMILNATALAKAGLGLDWMQKNELTSAQLALRNAWDLAPDFHQRIAKINFSGAEEAALTILES
jgi:UDP-N-acetylglucosamine:LPS N-acetylglucosamine transferase